MPGCPVTRALRHLKRFAGFPVPYSTLWRNDKPDFRDADPRRWLECVQSKLCAICGRKLGETAYYIGGPLAAENFLFLDPAMHEVCARESMKVCPFLNGTRPHYRGTDIEAPALMDVSGRPEKMFLLKGKTKAVRLIRIKDQPLIYAGYLEAVVQF
jgi:hypothetical protein